MHEEPDDDVEFERELREAVARFDPVPADAVQRAVDGFTWRTIDGELAELVFDSLVPGAQPAGVRGGAEPRSLSFRGAAVTIELEITRSRRAGRLVGQLIPPRRAVVELRNPAGSVTVEADDLGRFRCESLRTGPLSLRCDLGPGTADGAVVTEWVAI